MEYRLLVRVGLLRASAIFFVADFMTKPDSFGEWTLSPRAWDETTATAGEDDTRSQITTTPSNQTNQVT
ncbi:hypothetical protein PDIG_88300 [Penicillium digitatum PHI26]|uniref:Uncharacterized protein n=1 Tax=Penicillium digitatum (strain PHI26 / CECT 20796) TaxID=1170229 RepID=K9FPC9_PEND2|nr:hypothetical protein PDIG_88300 [Penicillium digitatum PHI26]